MKALFAAILAGVGCLLMSARWARAGAECPAVVKGGDAFVVERGEQSKTEVTFGAGAVISAVTRFRGQPLLELRQYEGLIPLERIDRGHRTVFKPDGDLAKLFPLKPKQQIEVRLDAEEDASTTPVAVDLKMIGTDSLAIGACQYDVLKFEMTETWAGRKADPIVEYYSPGLKFVIAKEYPERNGPPTLIKYDQIRPTSH